MRSGDPSGSPPRSRAKGVPARSAPAEPSSGTPIRALTANDEPCLRCRRQWQSARTDRPHARLIIVSSTPVIEAFGGGTETRYICLDCGHTIIHSSGRFGKGWH